MATAPPASYTQTHRPMEVITPLGKDALLLIGFSGHEAISQLFSFQLDMLAPNATVVPFEKLLGQKITVRLDMQGGLQRFFNGVCIRVSQGMRDNNFTGYRMEIVPEFWKLTKRTDIRTFQHMAVPDILKKVLSKLDVTYEIQGTFQPRDYVVQYRETDYNFASRLMEEEGIYYFFKHTADGHTMVVANTPSSHPDLPLRPDVIFEETLGGKRAEDRVTRWEKVQELRSGKYRLWDHTFEMPYKSLYAERTIPESVQVGTVTHPLRVGGNEEMEIFDFPGDYAGRFDGVDSGGSPQPGEMQKIFDDNQRTASIRIDQEAVQSLVVQGVSTCRQFVSGHKFRLQRHFNADGEYVVTSAQHEAKANVDYRSGDPGVYLYQNLFTAIPSALPFRPPRVTPKPTVEGTRTAVVVGPPGEEIFTDKYGRVKIQLKWDRIGKHDADSSCWVRVTQPWAGQRWGMYHIPRIGQEVIVDFLEGDADQPIVTGMVFNAHQMPTYLGDGPDSNDSHNPHLSGIKTCSTPGGDGFNELRFRDTKGQEQVWMHAEHDHDTKVKNNSREDIDNDKHMNIGGAGGGAGGGGGKGGNLFEKIFNDKNLQVLNDMAHKIFGNRQHSTLKDSDQHTGGDKKDHVEKNNDVVVDGDRKTKVGKSDHYKVGQDRKEEAGQNLHLKVGQDRKEEVGQNLHLKVGQDRKEEVGQDRHLTVGQNKIEKIGDSSYSQVSKDLKADIGKVCSIKGGEEIYLNSKKIVLEAEDEVTIKGPGGFIKIEKGVLYIKGNSLVKINSGGSAGSGTQVPMMDAVSPEAPEAPEQAAVAKKAAPPDPEKTPPAVTGTPSQEGAPIGAATPGA